MKGIESPSARGSGRHRVAPVARLGWGRAANNSSSAPSGRCKRRNSLQNIVHAIALLLLSHLQKITVRQRTIGTMSLQQHRPRPNPSHASVFVAQCKPSTLRGNIDVNLYTSKTKTQFSLRWLAFCGFRTFQGQPSSGFLKFYG